ncbi:MAG: hypothetical protein OXH98_14785 [Caldilineaceae bacterium]|nr:hypothetical protein [Caldilineaceae bacterium]
MGLGAFARAAVPGLGACILRRVRLLLGRVEGGGERGECIGEVRRGCRRLLTGRVAGFRGEEVFQSRLGVPD